MPRRRTCVFDEPRRKKNARKGPSVAAQLIELDRLEEAARYVQYADEDLSLAPPSPRHDEDGNDHLEETESAPTNQPCVPEDPHPNVTRGDSTLMESIADYHKLVRRQRKANKSKKNWEDLIPKLHGAYVWLKSQTGNWTASTTFTDYYQKFCTCCQLATM